MVLVCLFFFNSISWSLPESTLAAYTNLTENEFKEMFKAKEFLLAKEGVHEYIRTQVDEEKGICKKDWKKRRTEVVNLDDLRIRGRIGYDVRGLHSAVFIRVAGFLASTGQPAYVELNGEEEEFEGMLTVYIDSMLTNTPDKAIQKHEIDEILQWENLRINILHISTREKMYEWIVKNIDKLDLDDDISGRLLEESEYAECKSSRQIAKKIHKNSYPLDFLYDNEFVDSLDFDYSYIGKMLSLYGTDERSGHLNIAAKKTSKGQGTGAKEPVSVSPLGVRALLTSLSRRSVLRLLFIAMSNRFVAFSAYGKERASAVVRKNWGVDYMETQVPVVNLVHLVDQAKKNKLLHESLVFMEVPFDLNKLQMKIVASGKPLELDKGLIYHGTANLDEALLHGSLKGECLFTRVAHEWAIGPFAFAKESKKKKDTPAILMVHTDDFNRLVTDGKAKFTAQLQGREKWIEPYPKIDDLSLDIVRETWVSEEDYARYQRIANAKPDSGLSEMDKALLPARAKLRVMLENGKLIKIPGLRKEYYVNKSDDLRLLSYADVHRAVGLYMKSRNLFRHYMPYFKIVGEESPFKKPRTRILSTKIAKIANVSIYTILGTAVFAAIAIPLRSRIKDIQNARRAAFKKRNRKRTQPAQKKGKRRRRGKAGRGRTVKKGTSKGCAAELLNVLKDKRNYRLLKKALSNKGVTVDDAEGLRKPHVRKTVQKEFKILVALGIFIPIKGNPYHCRMSKTLKGPNLRYTRDLIDAINDIEYLVGIRGRWPLWRYDIPEEKIPTVKELVKNTIRNIVASSRKIIEDTTKKKNVGDIVRLGRARYRIVRSRHNTFHTKKARRLDTNEYVWLKFHLAGAQMGKMEARRIKKLQERPIDHFVNGQTFEDSKGNIVNIFEHIEGETLHEVIQGIKVGHREYFKDHFPDLALKLLDLARALQELHERLKITHSDIHLKNIIIQDGTRKPFLIDYDFPIMSERYSDIEELGLSLLDLALKSTCAEGSHTLYDFPKLEFTGGELWDEEVILNARKIYSYIPEDINNILLRFADDCENRYKTASEFADDLEKALRNMTALPVKKHGKKTLRIIAKVEEVKKVLEIYSNWKFRDYEKGEWYHANVLNEEGQALLEELEAAYQALQKRKPTAKEIKAIKGLINRVPSVKNPHPELFVDILPGVPKKIRKRIFKTICDMGTTGKCFNVLVTRGCYNQCAFCQFEAPLQISHMPFPLFIKILDEYVKYNDVEPILHRDSDPFHYRDRAIGANLADLYKAIKKRGLEYSALTGGWNKTNKIAQTAAERLARSDIEVEVSFNLFKKSLMEAVKQNDKDKIKAAYKKCKKRYKNILETLRPVIRIVRLEFSGRTKDRKINKLTRKMYDELKEELELPNAFEDNECPISWLPEKKGSSIDSSIDEVLSVGYAILPPYDGNIEIGYAGDGVIELKKLVESGTLNRDALLFLMNTILLSHKKGHRDIEIKLASLPKSMRAYLHKKGIKKKKIRLLGLNKSARLFFKEYYRLFYSEFTEYLESKEEITARDIDEIVQRFGYVPVLNGMKYKRKKLIKKLWIRNPNQCFKSEIVLYEAAKVQRDIDSVPSRESNKETTNALKIMTDFILPGLKKGEVYEIRYNKLKFDEYQRSANLDAKKNSPRALLQTYIDLLRMGAPKGSIKIIPCYRDDRPLISVSRYASRDSVKPVGVGNVDMAGDIRGQPLRIVGMLNMAFAASHIPNDVFPDEIHKYTSLLNFIKNQYKDITGKILKADNLLEAIRWITLPAAKPIPVQNLADYYRLTIEQLRQAA